MIAAAFLAFMLLTSNPFTRLVSRADRRAGPQPAPAGSRPRLPPAFLYLGYVGLSMAFSFAAAALIEGRVDAAWARWVRPWTSLAWMFADRRHRARLLVGLLRARLGRLVVLGSGRERLLHALAGLGGAAALRHRGREAERLKNWTILLAILGFSLSLLGTFLVRSGVLTSVHAFAVDPSVASSSSAVRWRCMRGARRSSSPVACSRRSAVKARWWSTTCC
jgi:cytochrome c-type biogenesis protein CcmF